MRFYAKRQMSDTFLIGAILAIVGGFLDAYTYLMRGGVFANAQTGNIVLFGISLAEQNWLSAFEYFIPISAFICGVFVNEWVKKYFINQRKFHWRQIILLFEILVLFWVTFLPLGGKSDMLANILVSFVCSMQTQSFRKVHGLPYATTMCTGNLRSGTEHFWRFTQSHTIADSKKGIYYYGINLFFILGAGIGAFLCRDWGTSAPLFCSVLLSAVCILLTIPNPEN